MTILGNSGQGDKGTPDLGAAKSGVDDPVSGCSRNWGEGVTIIFLTLDDLRQYGPLALREYLKRQQRPKPQRAAQVVEFVPHQAAAIGGGS
jgi:hypothetical protein